MYFRKLGGVVIQRKKSLNTGVFPKSMCKTTKIYTLYINLSNNLRMKQPPFHFFFFCHYFNSSFSHPGLRWGSEPWFLLLYHLDLICSGFFDLPWNFLRSCRQEHKFKYCLHCFYLCDLGESPRTCFNFFICKMRTRVPSLENCCEDFISECERSI